MSCGSCTVRGGTSGNSARLSLVGGRRIAVYRKPTSCHRNRGMDESMQTRQNKTIISNNKLIPQKSYNHSLDQSFAMKSRIS